MQPFFLIASQGFLSVYLIIYGAEWLYLTRTKSYSPLFGSEVIRLRLQDQGLARTTFLKSKKVKPLAIILPFSILLLGISILLASILGVISEVPIVLGLILFFLFNLCYGFGFEGSDQMSSILLCCLCVCVLYPSSIDIVRLFIIAQLMLSYAVSGIAKVCSPYWRVSIRPSTSFPI